MINIQRALEIEGWMFTSELEWLAQEAQLHFCIVEIGSYLGRSTRALGDNTPGCVYAIDDWYGPRDVEIPEDIREQLFSRFQQNLLDLIDTEKVYPITTDHAEIKLDIQPDMVFLDGDHSYASIKRDILIWLPRLGKGGLLCGHDVHNFDVANALLDTIHNVPLVPGMSIWSINV